ncbi:hypothetical protein [Agrilutibacter solisilvae]|uniref:Uncharacterized protein n=1 Tax=Agrilutibacter solisilvae TaxID=2763317 RepID=A0A974Y3C7_9GAMM|nr:hypothetical protein [Lysobacter solisilvae]QSX79725.1 hypothetical protein I8J32_007775 [Lysobacter solisilvae]
MSKPQRISISALLAHPERHEGKPVTVVGFYHGSFEHSAIYLAQADFQHHVRAHGIWVANRIPDSLSDRYVELDGIFTSSRGHLGQWPGTICGISRAVAAGADAP